jgi:hypothetical protein
VERKKKKKEKMKENGYRNLKEKMDNELASSIAKDRIISFHDK